MDSTESQTQTSSQPDDLLVSTMMTTTITAPTPTTTNGPDVKKPDDLDTTAMPGDGFTSRTPENYTPITTPSTHDVGEGTTSLPQGNRNAFLITQKLHFPEPEVNPGFPDRGTDLLIGMIFPKSSRKREIHWTKMGWHVVQAPL